MENNLTNQTWWPVTLTMKQAMEYTGYSRQNLQELIDTGKLQFIPGLQRNRRIPRHQIDELVGLKSETEQEETNQFRNL